ncbi:MAG TPA: hypothetical protein PKN61_12960 [Acidobacteriota bacterium]|nr:hypothetical protein [Acidobacteriota bacterium]HNR39936.1 hypothetical protein [Acidobacteriota bacterium]HNU02203.1 hypothetical protein [Acidobacteriota bacterium]HPB29009.1 hypothetical protein [Acidobacteriota bacterium]HQO27255.1 hypothetical protein [Acidobacteriota bacterium]
MPDHTTRQPANGATADNRDRRRDLRQWREFLSAQSHLLAERPGLIFQQAANQPDASAPARSARGWDNACRVRSPWFRWTNKPQHLSPCIQTLAGHRYPVHACAFLPDGRRLVSAGGAHRDAPTPANSELIVWDLATGSERLRLAGHAGAVLACAVSPDGTRVVSGAMDRSVRVWDLADGRLLAAWREHAGPVRSCAWSPDGTRFASASDDGTVRIWEPGGDHAPLRLAGSAQGMTSCAFRPDGEAIVAGSADGVIRVWNAATGAAVECRHTEPDGVLVACSPDGRWILAARRLYSGGLVLLDAATLETERSFAGNRHAYRIRSCAFSPDSRWFVTGSECGGTMEGFRVVGGRDGLPLQLWDAAGGALIAAADADEHGVRACAVSPDGTRIATGGSRFIRIWDVAALWTVPPPARHWAEVLTCAIAPDRRLAATGSLDRTLKLWTVPAGAEVASFGPDKQPVLCCAFSPAGDQIASGHGDQYSARIRFRDIRSGAELVDAPTAAGVTSLWYSPDGARLVAAGAHELDLWQTRPPSLITGFPGSAPVACAPEGRRLAVALPDHSLCIRDLTDGRTLATYPPGPATAHAWAFSPDGVYVAVSDGARESPTLRLLDTRNGRLTAFQAVPFELHACAFSGDGRQVLARSWNGQVAGWDARTGRRTAACGRAEEYWLGTAFSTDAHRAVIASLRSGVAWCDASTGAELAFFPLAGQVRAIATGGRAVIAGDASGAVTQLAVAHDAAPRMATTATYIYEHERAAWADRPLVRCGWCGARMAIDARVLDTLSGIARNLGLATGAATCLDLPDAAWEEPRLEMICPDCRQAVWINPFVCDRRDLPDPPASHPADAGSSVRISPLPLDTTSLAIEPGSARLIPEGLCRRHTVVPLALSGDRLTVAAAHALDQAELDELVFGTGYSIGVTIAPRDAILAAMAQLFSSGNK